MSCVCIALKQHDLQVWVDPRMRAVNDMSTDECIKVTPDQLESFLQRTKLSFFSFGGDEMCEDYVGSMTNGGKALKPLSENDELRVLRADQAVFCDVQDLTCLLRSCLRQLDLSNLRLGVSGLAWSDRFVCVSACASA